MFGKMDPVLAGYGRGELTYEYISQHRDENDPGKVDAVVKDAIRGKVGCWIDLLDSADKA